MLSLALMPAFPAHLEGSVIVLVALWATPFFGALVTERVLQDSAGPIIVGVFFQPEFHPGMEGGGFTHDAGSVLVLQKHLDAVGLENVPRIGDEEAVLVGIDHLHGVTVPPSPARCNAAVPAG